MAEKNHWLFKQEPESFGWKHLVAHGSTWWDGVENALACKHLQAIRPHDLIFLYHTGKEKAVVGEMRALSGPAIPPKALAGSKPTVEVAPIRPLPRPVSLAEIKADPLLAGWDLVRLPRLSVMPVSSEQWNRIWELANSNG
jgi:predicted RNA-binding protein with PUA-like domain